MSLNVNEVPSRGGASGTSPLGDSSRQDEVKRLAQGVAAEHFGVGQQQQFQNGNSSPIDTARISDEAIEEISRSGRPEEIQRSDQLVGALRQAFESKAPQEDRQRGQSGDSAAQPQGEAGGQPQKRSEKKRTAHWDPLAQENQIHAEGREVIGKITIKEEVREVSAPGESSSNGGNRNGASSGGPSPAQSTSSGSGNSSVVPGGNSGGNGNSTTAPQGGKDSQRARDDDNKDQKEGAAMAQSLRSSGLQAQGLEQGAQNYEVGEKTKDFDVRSPATGASQTLTIRGAGQLGEGEQKLGTYKKLDDRPALRYASLHARGQNLEQTANSYAQGAAQQGESPDQIRAGVERLKRTTPDSEG